MSLITRTSKGSKLTIQEMDSNLLYLQDLANSGGGGSTTIIELTYTELTGLTSTSGLTSNQQYLLTDFQTVHYMFDGNTRLNEINTGIVEPLLLTSSSTTDIYPECRSMLYPQDIIHYDFNSEKWMIDPGFANAESVGGTLLVPDLTNVTLITGYKGVIYRREDTKNNVVLGYDFRNVKFRRWNDFNSSGYYMGVSSTSAGVTRNIDYIDCYTFNGFDEYNTYDISVKNVIIDNVYDNYIQGNGNISSMLSNTVFYLGGNDINHQSINCYDIKSGSYFELNTFGISNNSMIFGNDNNYNIFGNYNYSIVFGNGNSSMTFGDSNYNMTFGNDNSSISLGTGNYMINLENSNSEFVFVDSNYSLNFGNNNSSLSLGSYNYDINMKDSNSVILFLDNNYSITFGYSNGSITFGSNNNSIVLKSDNSTITFGDQNYYMSFENYNSYTEFGTQNYNIIFGNGNSYITFVNSNYSITFGDTNSYISLGNGDYSMIFGDSNSSITFGDTNYSMTFGNGNSSITFDAGNSYNIFGDYNLNSIFTGITLINNEFKSNMDFGSINFSSSTHLTIDYYCEIYKRPDFTPRLKYIDDTDSIIIVDVNS